MLKSRIGHADINALKPATKEHPQRIDKKRVIQRLLFLVSTGSGTLDRARDFSDQARYSATITLTHCYYKLI